VLQFIAVCCSAYITVCCSELQCVARSSCRRAQGLTPLSPPFGVVCCSVLQCIAACCVLQCVAVFCGVLQCVAVCCSGCCSGCVYIGLLGSSFEGFAVVVSQMCCNVLQCVAMCCSVLLSRSRLSTVPICQVVKTCFFRLGVAICDAVCCSML